MRVRYTLRAIGQIALVLDRIALISPTGADNLQARIRVVVAILTTYPMSGRTTSKSGIRRIPVNPYPYLIDYSFSREEIVVRRFRHGARKPIA